MKTRLGLLGLLTSLVMILGLTGCAAAVAQNPPSTSPAITGNGTSPVTVNVANQQGIWVSGQGTVTVTPNLATLSVGVSVQASKVADAQTQAATIMTNVISSLASNGVDQKDISTRYYTISPLTRYDNSTQQSIITGYEVSNIVNVIVRSVDKVGVIIDAATAAGGDATRVTSISFSVDKPDQYYSQARSTAMADAKVKAQQLAGLAGVSLGQAFYVSESINSTPIPYAVSVPSVGAATPTTPINPGQTDIILNVQVAYTVQ